MIPLRPWACVLGFAAPRCESKSLVNLSLSPCSELSCLPLSHCSCPLLCSLPLTISLSLCSSASVCPFLLRAPPFPPCRYLNVSAPLLLSAFPAHASFCRATLCIISHRCAFSYLSPRLSCWLQSHAPVSFIHITYLSFVTSIQLSPAPRYRSHPLAYDGQRFALHCFAPVAACPASTTTPVAFDRCR